MGRYSVGLPAQVPGSEPCRSAEAFPSGFRRGRRRCNGNSSARDAYRDCDGLIAPVVGSSCTPGQLHARATFSLISDTPESWKLASLLLPSAVVALMKTLPPSGSARIRSTGCGAKAARPFWED